MLPPPTLLATSAPLLFFQFQIVDNKWEARIIYR